MVRATAASYVAVAKTMVRAAAACLHSVFLSPKSQREGNGRLPAPCVFVAKTMVKAMGACLLRSPCVFGTKTMVKAMAACLHRVVAKSPVHLLNRPNGTLIDMLLHMCISPAVPSLFLDGCAALCLEVSTLLQQERHVALLELLARVSKPQGSVRVK